MVAEPAIEAHVRELVAAECVRDDGVDDKSRWASFPRLASLITRSPRLVLPLHLFTAGMLCPFTGYDLEELDCEPSKRKKYRYASDDIRGSLPVGLVESAFEIYLIVAGRDARLWPLTVARTMPSSITVACAVSGCKATALSSAEPGPAGATLMNGTCNCTS